MFNSLSKTLLIVITVWIIVGILLGLFIRSSNSRLYTANKQIQGLLSLSTGHTVWDAVMSEERC